MIQASRPQPFVGVCGVQSNDDLHKLERRAQDILPSTGRFLMAGVKNAVDVSSVSNDSQAVRIFVHCTFSGETPFEELVFRNLKLTSHCVYGLQLNALPWMQADFTRLFRVIKQRYPKVVLMLQVYRRIMESYTPKQIAYKLRGLPVDYVFFDPSQSQSICYNPSVMAAYVDTISQYHPSAGIVVAGGLSGETMQALFQPLAHTFANLSCDAFGRLVDPLTGSLSWPDVDRYLYTWRTCMLEAQAAHATVNS